MSDYGHSIRKFVYDYATDNTKRYNYTEFTKKYPNDDVCLEELWKIRYGTIKQCPKCMLYTRFYRVKNRKSYQCGRCQYTLSPCAHTIFHKSSVPLTFWFYALYLFSIRDNKLSAKELEQKLGVTYKTAWRMRKLIQDLTSQENKHA